MTVLASQEYAPDSIPLLLLLLFFQGFYLLVLLPLCNAVVFFFCGCESLRALRSLTSSSSERVRSVMGIALAMFMGADMMRRQRGSKCTNQPYIFWCTFLSNPAQTSHNSPLDMTPLGPCPKVLKGGILLCPVTLTTRIQTNPEYSIE